MNTFPAMKSEFFCRANENFANKVANKCAFVICSCILTHSYLAKSYFAMNQKYTFVCLCLAWPKTTFVEIGVQFVEMQQLNWTRGWGALQNAQKNTESPPLPGLLPVLDSGDKRQIPVSISARIPREIKSTKGISFSILVFPTLQPQLKLFLRKRTGGNYRVVFVLFDKQIPSSEEKQVQVVVFFTKHFQAQDKLLILVRVDYFQALTTKVQNLELSILYMVHFQCDICLICLLRWFSLCFWLR